MPKIEIPDALYARLGQHARAFETPAQVIERLLDIVDSREPHQIGQENAPTAPAPTPATASLAPASRTLRARPGHLEIVFHPEDIDEFKTQLLEHRQAWILLIHEDGEQVLKRWNAFNFRPTSEVMANLRSGHLRGWRERGIVRAEVAIDKADLNLE